MKNHTFEDIPPLPGMGPSWKRYAYPVLYCLDCRARFRPTHPLHLLCPKCRQQPKAARTAAPALFLTQHATNNEATP